MTIRRVAGLRRRTHDGGRRVPSAKVGSQQNLMKTKLKTPCSSHLSNIYPPSIVVVSMHWFRTASSESTAAASSKSGRSK